MTEPTATAGTPEADAMAVYLAPTEMIDSDHPDVVAFAREAVEDAADEIAKACKLYYAVRDGFLYDPYSVELTPEGFRASTCLARGRGFCVTKAVLLAAACRAVGLPARLGFADVRNHLATKRLTDLMGTDLFVFHGYSDIFLDGKWVKATPAFNLRLCEKFRVLPLEFDGRTDSVFHPYDASGRKHMEYVRDRGQTADVPLNEIRQAFVETYPGLYPQYVAGGAEGDFEAEAAAEN